jgi:flavorubredoxin
VPFDRVYWMNARESILAGDRKLTAVRPPLFDNPTTIDIYDNKSEAFFSADCFGGLIPAPAETADEVSNEDLARGTVSWANLDAPWVYMTDRGLFGKAVDNIRQIGPKIILSSHLPPASGRMEEFLELLGSVANSTPMLAPNHAAMEQMMSVKSGK